MTTAWSILKNLFVSILGVVGVSSLAVAGPSYNYFSPGGALSCTGNCTQQFVNLASGSFLTGLLPASKVTPPGTTGQLGYNNGGTWSGAPLLFQNTVGFNELSIIDPSIGVLDTQPGTQLQILAGAASTPTQSGIILNPGAGASGSGGSLTVFGGAAAVSGAGGGIVVTGGAAAGSNQSGGSLTLEDGSSTGTGSSGVFINTGGTTRIGVFDTGALQFGGSFGTSGQPLLSGTPTTFGALNLANSSAVTGTLPQANILACNANQVVFDNGSAVLTCSPNLSFDGSTTLTLGSTSATFNAAAAATLTSTAPPLNLSTQNGGSTSGSGGKITIATGSGNGSGTAISRGGDLAITTGAGSGSPTASLNARGGDFSVTLGIGGGTGAGTQRGGNLSLTAGAGSNSANVGPGGSFLMTAGAGAGAVSGNGGVFSISAGSSALSGSGGALTLSSGNGAGTGSGGAVSITLGSAGASAASAGNFSVTGGSAAAGTGSNIILTPGTGSTTANGGQTILQSPSGTNTLIVDQFGNVICTCNTTASATDGFSYIGASASVPTGTPAHTTGIYANSIPLRYDTSDSRLYAYNTAWVNVSDLSHATGTLNNPSLSGHLAFSGSAPVVSACGTSPAIDANATDNAGMVTVGSVAAASCTVTFATAYSTFNHCRVTSQSVIASFAYSYTLSAITVTGTSLVGDKFDYSCDGT